MSSRQLLPDRCFRHGGQYTSLRDELAAKIAAHQFIGPPAFRHGVKKVLKLYPGSADASATLERDLAAFGVLQSNGPPDMGYKEKKN